MTTRLSLVRSNQKLITSAVFAGTFLMQPMASHGVTTPVAPTAGVKDDAGQQTYYGLLNDDNVYVRSGPSDERFYATAKLGKGARVTVVGAKDDWLKIIPPEGAYCYVAKAYVEKRGDGSVGRVTKPDLNVRAGSLLNSLKTTVQTSLEEGDDVKIVGEETEYFKISPPPGAYLYIKKNFVDPMPQVAINPTQPVQVPATPEPRMNYPMSSNPIPPVVAVTPAASTQPTAATNVPSAGAGAGTVGSASGATTPGATPPVSSLVSTAPATQPAVVALAPSTQPVEPPADVKFETLENAFLDATNLPLDQQPMDSLMGQYTALAADASLPAPMKHIAERRITLLRFRMVARKDQFETQKMQADANARRQALKAENDELAQKFKDNQVAVYSALGTLRISSLQQTGATMYRLTDPGTGRTLLYIKSNDAKYTDLLNKFIGVKGDITEDSNMNLKVINPTSTEVVDASKVNTTVTATVMPPSLLAKTASATIAGN